MIISDPKEIDLILKHRAEVESYRQAAEKKKSCTHNFRYEGHSHNDDAYVCTKCGEIEWR